MRRRTLSIAVIGSVALTGAAFAAPSGASPLPGGCSAQSVGYHSSGESAGSAATAPYVCVGRTGYGGAESHIRVAPNGTVVQQPALIATGIPSYMQAGLAVTTNHGASWRLAKMNSALSQPQDNAIHIDRVTGRLYMVLSSGFGFGIAGESELLSSPASSNGYVKWTSTIMHGTAGSENSRFTSAPAPRGAKKPRVGERMAYWCGNRNAGLTNPFITDRSCWRTYDGGATWKLASVLFTSGAPTFPECGTSATSYSAGDGNYPQGGPDGSLWVMVQCAGQTFLARSGDEAKTFAVVKNANGKARTIPFTPPPSEGDAADLVALFGERHELRVDDSNNLYAVELEGSSLLLRISRDRGRTWGAPLNMTAPAARSAEVFQWGLAVGKPGQVAVSYLTARPKGGYDGYVSMTKNALSAAPTFYGSRVNAATAPLVTTSAPGDDYIDLDIGPGGSAYAAFYSDCPTDGTDVYCAAALDHPIQPQANAVAGPQAETVARLVWPSG